MGKLRGFLKRPRVFVPIISIVILALAVGGWAVLNFGKSSDSSQDSDKKETQFGSPSATESSKQTKPGSFDYTLVAYKGQVFGAKIPKGWEVTDNESGIDIMDPKDHNTGAAGAVAVGWYGYQSPDGFISFMLQSIGAADVKYLNQSAEESIKDPTSGLVWKMKTKTFTFKKSGKTIKAKASAGVLNGYGQFMGMTIAFQTTPGKWGTWAPTLERVAKSITIINPAQAGGIDKVRLPTAVDLSNDSSPLMDAWEYRNSVQEKTSHEFSDAIMGQESDLISPSTGQTYTLPLTSYDPTIGGYRNPDKPSETLTDPY